MNSAPIRLAWLSAVWLIVVAATFAPCPADAQEEKKPDAERAVTTANPAIPVDELELLLAPLAKHELAVEAEGWHALLKAKVFEISAVEIAVKHKNIEIKKAKALAELADEAREPVDDSKGDRTKGDSSSVTKSAEGHSSPVEAGDLEELKKKTAEVAQATKSARALLFEDLDALRGERNAIIERFQVVLDAWKAKGGEIQDYALYIEAVDDVKIDIADTVTAWTTMLDWASSQVEALAKRLSVALFDIVIMVLLALAVWIAVKAAVKRHVGSDRDSAAAGSDGGDSEGGGTGATRVETLLPLLQKFITITLTVFVVMISLSSLGVDVAPLLAGAGMVGIAIGFGAQTLVRDVMSGFFFLLDDAFRMGEYVEIDAIRGSVEKISVRSLQLRHHNGPVHTVPFGEIRHLTNYSRDYAIMKFEIRLPFETDIDKVRKIIKKVGLEMMEDETLGPMMLGPLKSQGVNRMDDSSLIVRCKFTAKPGEQFVLRREAYMLVQQALAEAGIHFAPRRVIVETAPSAAAVSPQAVQAAAGSVDSAPLDAEGGAAADKRS